MSQEIEQILDSSFLHQLERLAIINKQLKKGLYSGKRKSKNQGSSIEFADYRSYTPGDDFRQIDWNAYARHEKLFLKTYYDEQELNISIYLDCSKSMEFGNPPKFTTGIKLAAALGYLSLNNFDRVSIYAFDQKIRAQALSLMGKAKTHQLFSFLKQITITENGDIDSALTTGAATQGKPGISIILSDFLFESYEKGISFIQAANQEVILVQILSAEEREPFLDGDVRLLDSESKKNREISFTPKLMEDYQRSLYDFQERLTEFAHKRGISFLKVDSEMDIEEIIFNIFKRSGLIR